MHIIKRTLNLGKRPEVFRKVNFEKRPEVSRKVNFENVPKCPAKSKRKPPVCNRRIRVTVFVSSRIIVRRALYDLYCPYFSPAVVLKFTRNARGYFVTACLYLRAFPNISGPSCSTPD